MGAEMRSEKQVENKTVKIELKHNEALVIFEFLSRFNETGKLEIIDAGESQALNNLLCYIEQQSEDPAPFQKNYHDLVKKARASLRYE
jgi:hypothetical protein